jgi:O-antigen ligase
MVVVRGNLIPRYLIGSLVVFTIIALIALAPYFKIHGIVTLGLIPSLTLIAMLMDIKTVHINNREFLSFVLIFISALCSVLYVINYDFFIDNLTSLLGALMAAYISLGINKNRDYTAYFHYGFIIAALILIGIMYLNGNFSFTDFANRVDYRDRFLLNANAYSYFTYFANFSLLYLYERHKSFFIKVSLFVFPILFLIISFVTQSRSGLLMILLINSIYWIFINKPNSTNGLKRLLRRLIIFVSLMILAIQFLRVYQNSRIKSRVESSISQGDARGLLLQESLSVFGDHPIFGVGLGQLPLLTSSKQFSHNSYVEILAEQGIIGGIFLLILFFIPFLKSYSLFKRDTANPILKLNLLFFVTFLIYNNFYPFYKFPFSMMYFFLIISIQNKPHSTNSL